MRKSVISMILSASLVFGLCPFSGTGQKVSAAAQPPVSQIVADLPSETVSGTFGSNGDEENPKDLFTWSFNPFDFTLTIGTTDAVQTGKGITPDYTATNYTTAPWHEYHESIKKVVFTGAVEGIGAYSFANDYTALDTVDISGAAKLTTVGKNAFYKAEALATVTGMEQLVTLNDMSFGATGLKKVNLPNAVSIAGPFQDCKSLQELTMDAVNVITGSVVKNCTALTTRG